MMYRSPALSIGIHPRDLDYSRHPDIDEARLTALVEAGNAALREAGFDVVSCLVPTDPDAAEAKLRETLASGSFRVAMIGGGVRLSPENTLLFERVINVLITVVPGIHLCFNTSPTTTIDALRRWIQPTTH
ncbi:hypothetical protein ACIP5Y_41125 [Nocardia sp. NPDC088792]|uniref:hypothetical protein n=1 Tax=Nocardia sp. NPDC088792 TaxID=3364332 RepID=UPI0038259FFB